MQIIMTCVSNAVPMAIEEQVPIIYCGVRGHIDKVDPNKITKFEKEFSQHMKASHTDILASIAKEGLITPDMDAKLKKVVQEFVAAFQAK